MWTWSYPAAGITKSSSFFGIILDGKLMLKLLVSCHTKRREWKLGMQPQLSSFLWKLKLHLTKLQPRKHSLTFSNVLLSWPIYSPKERKILYHYVASDNCVSSGGLKMRWFDGEIIGGVRCDTKLSPFLGELSYAICYWKVKHLFQQWFSCWLCSCMGFCALIFTSSWSFSLLQNCCVLVHT